MIKLFYDRDVVFVRKNNSALVLFVFLMFVSMVLGMVYAGEEEDKSNNTLNENNSEEIFEYEHDMLYEQLDNIVTNSY